METEALKKSLRKELNIVFKTLPQDEIKRQSKILSQQVSERARLI
jgi:hypothetical protein